MNPHLNSGTQASATVRSLPSLHISPREHSDAVLEVGMNVGAWATISNPISKFSSGRRGRIAGGLKNLTTFSK